MNSINAQTTYLLIDAGNTRIKFALADRSAQGFKFLGSCASLSNTTEIAAFLTVSLQGEPTLNAANKRHMIHVHGVCVAGDAVKQTIANALNSVLQSLLFFSQPTAPINWLTGLSILPGLRNDYTTPATLGADRWLAAYGLSQQCMQDAGTYKLAHAHTAAAVLATFGTATTVDVVYWDAAQGTHVFVGGIIVVGLNTALRSVSSSTAQLPDMRTALAQLQHNDGVAEIPNCTNDALLLGALLAQAGAVRCVLDLTAQRYGTAQCFMAGGAASVMQPYLRQPYLTTQKYSYADAKKSEQNLKQNLEQAHIQTLEYPVFMGLASFIGYAAA